MNFKKHWQQINEVFQKSDALTDKELKYAQGIIADKTKKGWIASSIIKELQAKVPKLKEQWKAERVYWTEVKAENTETVADLGEDLDIEKYKVILSPHPCHVCIEKTNNGKKIFTQDEVNKAERGNVPPFHPNCFCILIPHLD